MVKFFRYDFPSIKGEGWGTIVMCSDGYFSTVSDWGNYSFWWTHFGERDFREFLLGCDADYIRRKLNSDEVMDGEATEKRLCKYVCQARRQKQFDQVDARELWHDAYVRNDLELWDWIRKFGDAGGELPGDYVEDVPVYKPDPSVMGFVTYLLPRLKDVLRAELEKEKAVAQQPDHRHSDGPGGAPSPR